MLLSALMSSRREYDNICKTQEFHLYIISLKGGINIFTNKRFITRGINGNIPPLLQIALWKLIDEMPVSKDYLQVFSLSAKGGKLKVVHSQEEP